MLTEKMFWSMMEGAVIRPLLGDQPTFTTQRYCESWMKWMAATFGPPPEDFDQMDLNSARNQLTALSPLIVQIEADVWLFVGDQPADPSGSDGRM